MEDDSIDMEGDLKMTVSIWKMTVSIWETTVPIWKMTVSRWDILSLCPCRVVGEVEALVVPLPPEVAVVLVLPADVGRQRGRRPAAHLPQERRALVRPLPRVVAKSKGPRHVLKTNSLVTN